VVTTAVGVAVVVVGAFAPWVRTGRRRRSSFDLVGVADRLGVVPSGVATVLARGWVLVPLLGAVALAALVIGAHRVAAVASVATGVYTLAMVWFVATSPLGTEAGLTTSMVGGMITVIGGLFLGWAVRADRRKAGKDERAGSG
jgi:hypothetical protein